MNIGSGAYCVRWAHFLCLIAMVANDWAIVIVMRYWDTLTSLRERTSTRARDRLHHQGR